MKILSSITALAVFLTVGAASAAPECADTQDVYDILRQKFGETRVVGGISRNGYLLEVFANREAGSWTVVATVPDGQSCIIDEGGNFHQSAPEALGEDM